MALNRPPSATFIPQSRAPGCVEPNQVSVGASVAAAVSALETASGAAQGRRPVHAIN